MITKITMFTCDYCSGVDYFITNNVKQAKKAATKDRRSPWIFKEGKEFCCKECYERYKDEFTTTI